MIKKLYLLWFLTELSITSALLVPLYFLRHISEQQVFVLIAVYQISILLAEIPTWLIASRFWEKRSIILWFLCCIIFNFLIPFIDSFSGFIFLQIISAISVAFLSWSLATFIHELCKTHNHTYLQVRSTYKIIGFTTSIVSTIIGWFLLYFGYSAVFFLQGCFFIFAIILLISIRGNPVHILKEIKIFTVLKKSFWIITKREIFLPVIFVFTFLSIEASVYISFQTEYIKTLSLDPKYLGVLLSVFLLVSMFFTRILPHKKWILHPLFLIGIGIIFITVSYVHIIFGWFFTLLFLYLTQIIRPMNIPIENEILSKVNDKTGSTVLSLVWFFERWMFLLMTISMIIFSINWIHAILYFSVIATVLFIAISFKDFFKRNSIR